MDQASHLNMKLGLGIAFFQGLSNVALNCEWCLGGGTDESLGCDFTVTLRFSPLLWDSMVVAGANAL